MEHIKNTIVKTAPLIDESDVLRRLRDGDELAFEQLYVYYSNVLFWKLKKMVKDHDQADELLQELFVKVWERRGQIDPELPFIGYLYRIAKYMVVDYYRKLALIKNAYDYIQSDATEIESTTEQTIEVNEMKELLDQAIDLLPNQRKRAFTLCKIEGKSHQEAAEIMNISPNTVHNHLVKATKTVKTYLESAQNMLAPIILIQVISQL